MRKWRGGKSLNASAGEPEQEEERPSILYIIWMEISDDPRAPLALPIAVGQYLQILSGPHRFVPTYISRVEETISSAMRFQLARNFSHWLLARTLDAIIRWRAILLYSGVSKRLWPTM